MNKAKSILLLFIAASAAPAFAASENVKGMLSEISMSDNNEDANLKKSFESEVMITKIEGDDKKSGKVSGAVA